MITYDRSPFGINLIFRIHGSAIYRAAAVPGLVSVLWLWLLRLVLVSDSVDNSDFNTREVKHPYAVGILLSSTTFLLVFRVQQAYARYWEAATSVHHMMSKWMDAVVHTAVYHMQCDHYLSIKPPSFFEYPELNHAFLTRNREDDDDEEEEEDDDMLSPNNNTTTTCRSDAEQQQQRTFRNFSSSPRRQQKQHKRYIQSERMLQRANKYSIERVTESKQQKLPKRLPYTETRRRPLNSKSHSNLYTAGSGGGGSSSTSSHYQQQQSKSTSDLPHVGDANNSNHNSYSVRSGASLDNIMEDHHHHQDSNSNFASWGDVSSSSGNPAIPVPLEGPPRMDGNWGKLFDNNNNNNNNNNNKKKYATFWNPANNSSNKDPAGFASIQGGRTTPLFLQELAHLASLLTGVALSTLRNDIEGAQSPLDIYVPGAPWPAVDPTHNTEGSLTNSKEYWMRSFVYFLGMGRSPDERTKYNASRPLSVIGGVSEGEIAFLQMARGPYAKTQLCWMWLSEFIIREHLAGSLGKVGPPIISRIIQFLGDGMIYYNHARKIMFIPYPFPHAQLSAIYVIVIIPAVAGLMDQYIERLWLASLLVFFTVTCLHAIHEVARELENPFRNIPNELPLVTLQAQYNEALLVTYAGYHPDFFWQDHAKMYMPPPPTEKHDSNNNTESPVPPASSSGPNNAAGLRQRRTNTSTSAATTTTTSLQEQQPTISPSDTSKPDKDVDGSNPATTVLNRDCQRQDVLERQVQELMKQLQGQANELQELRGKVRVMKRNEGSILSEDDA